MDPKFSKNTELLEKLKEKKSTNIEYSNDSDDCTCCYYRTYLLYSFFIFYGKEIL